MTAERVKELFERHNMFPILESVGSQPVYIPYNIIAPHEAQAIRNHSQTLQRLAERGGLDWTEALAVLNDKTWKEMGYRFHLQEGEMEKAKEAVLAHIRERRDNKMKKAMLSQPMNGKTDDEIVATRERAVAALEKDGFEVVNTLFTDEWYSNEKMKERGVVQVPLCFLAKSLENMSLCHAAYFCEGWEKARGCRIEHDAAKAYGLEIIYEDDFNGKG